MLVVLHPIVTDIQRTGNKGENTRLADSITDFALVQLAVQW